MTNQGKMQTWEKRKNYTVVEKDFDYSLHEFAVIVDGKEKYTITPGDIDDMNNIIKALDAGEDIDGWDDGKGNPICIR